MKRILIIALMFYISHAKGQGIFINYDIDTAMYQISEPLNLWIDFLKTKDDSLGSKYWNQEELEKYGKTKYFLLENELQFGSNNFLQILSYSSIKILNVKKEQDYFKVTSIMEFNPEGGKSNIQYIFHVYIKERGNELKIYNALGVNTALHMETVHIGYINYHYLKPHIFNKKLAEEQSKFLLNFSKNFDIKLDTIQYYFASSQEVINKIKGLDFIIGNNGESFPSGKADPENKIVYSFGLNEYYPHELIHVVLYKKYNNMHVWLDEGVATFFGMSRGQELSWHLKKVNTFLLAHPDIDLNDLLKQRSVDQVTDFKYALGGYLIKYAYEKGGYELIKKLLISGSTNEQFYEALERHLGLNKNSLNSFFRSELKTKYSTK